MSAKVLFIITRNFDVTCCSSSSTSTMWRPFRTRLSWGGKKKCQSTKSAENGRWSKEQLLEAYQGSCMCRLHYHGADSTVQFDMTLCGSLLMFSPIRSKTLCFVPIAFDIVCLTDSYIQYVPVLNSAWT